VLMDTGQSTAHPVSVLSCTLFSPTWLMCADQKQLNVMGLLFTCHTINTINTGLVVSNNVTKKGPLLDVNHVGPHHFHIHSLCFNLHHLRIVNLKSSTITGLIIILLTISNGNRTEKIHQLLTHTHIPPP
jgi:hypothetical protein